MLNNLVSSVCEFERKMDLPVSLEAHFTLTYWTVQTVNALSAVFTGVVSAVWPQLAPLKKSYHKQHKEFPQLHVLHRLHVTVRYHIE